MSKTKFSKTDRQFVQNGIRDLIDGKLQNKIDIVDSEGKERQIAFIDTLRSRDLAPLVQENITKVLIENIEPNSVIYNTFFQEMKVDRSSSLQFLSTGLLSAEPIGENGTYPETNISFAQTGKSINIQFQKYGLAIRIDKEVLDEGLIDIVGIWLNNAKNALIRNREKMAVQEIIKYGITEVDNAAPTTSGKIVRATGRDISGNANGSFTLNDLMYMYSKAMVEGFILDTIVMHPFAWQVFMTDPEMKEIVLSNNTLVSFRAPNGNLFNNYKVLNGPNNLLENYNGTGNPTMDPATGGKLGPNPFVQTWLANQATLNLPTRNSITPTPITVVVSPLVPIKEIASGTEAGKYVTDLIYAAAGETGIVARKTDPIVDQYNNVERESLYIRMKEIFGMGVMNQGKSIRIAKNIVVDRNYVFQNANNATLAPINSSTTMPSLV